MKNTKKILSVLLVLLMCLTALPLSGFNLGTVASAAKKVSCANKTDFDLTQDYIYLGSYPQSKVTDEATITALNEKAPEWENWTNYGYYSGKNRTDSIEQGDWMRYTDVTYNGEKYRGVKFTQYRPDLTSNTSSSDNSRQDYYGYYTNIIYWFKFEDLKWRVLDASTGFIMCETIIDSQPYNNTIKTTNDWETSSIKEWLDKDFYNAAFTSADQSIIATSTPGKIFLLSCDEAINSNYGFSSNTNDYDTARQAQGSDYAKCQGLWVSTRSSYKENALWLLRTPGNTNKNCCRVIEYGLVQTNNYYSYCSDTGVRPALKLDLDSLHTWTHTDAKDATCTQDGNIEYWYCEDCKQYIIENEDGEKVVATKDEIVITIPSFAKDGNYITFGSYPQSKVTDSATISALNAKAPSWSNWTSYGYYTGTGSYGSMTQGDWMRYTDVTYNGEKYRGVKITQYRPYYTYSTSSSSYTYQDTNGYSTNTVYWFKFESLKWRVLDEGTGLIMCETIIDSQPYSNTVYSNGGTYGYFNDASYTHYASDYETSSIRAWLNDDFYNTAFTSADQSTIATTTLNNDGYYTLIGTTGYEKLDSNDTNDKIFLLSYDEAINSKYGFSSSYSTYDTARRVQGSDYAKCQGLWVSTISSYKGNSIWLLRSPGNGSYYCCEVGNDGYVDYRCNVNGSSYGVRPALKLDLDSLHTWTHTNAKDATCAEDGNVEYWYCEDCKQYIIENEDAEKVVTDDVSVPATNHNFGETVEVKTATCLGDGVKTAYKYCDKCKLYFGATAGDKETLSNGAETTAEFIENATGHTFTEVPSKDVTCLEDGNEAYKYCTACEKYFDANADVKATNGADTNEAYIITATGHNFTDIPYSPNSCVDTGNNAYRLCKNCHEYFDADADKFSEDGAQSNSKYILYRKGHSFGDTVEVKDTTCTENSVATAYKYCDRCELYYASTAYELTAFSEGKTDTSSFTTPATGHTFTDVPFAAANCTEPGNEAHKYCASCEKYFDTTAEKFDINGANDNSAYIITAIGHEFTGTIKMDTDGKDGTHSFACANGCGDYGKAVAHTWDDGKITTPATHLEEGVKTFTCACGATYTEPIAKIAEHNHIAGTPVEPTCTEQGYTLYTCECGDSYKADFVDALGHNYVGDICIDCGKEKVNACSCMCHVNIFAKLLYMIIDFILNYIGLEFDCECGISHY